MHVRFDGPEDGPSLVFANSLGTDFRIWDAVVQQLPEWRIGRFDKPGHGLSDRAPITSIDSMADDAAALIEVMGGRAAFVGLSIGGLIGLSLASRHAECVSSLVLSNTAAKIGTTDSWQTRIDTVEQDGLPSIADGVLEKWFSPAFQASDDIAPWRNMLTRTDPQGYADACRAIADADLRNAAPGLDLPVMAIAGSLDGSTPPDLVRETAAMIPGSRFEMIEGVGHIPCVETPDQYATLLRNFLETTR
ncbi:3-oxoadipate enol-lactonase [Paracoccus albicereus]|nr:3-oxoadipate enol-lactonase [Paracoccus albicereus]